jgi:hypothetical protein
MNYFPTSYEDSRERFRLSLDLLRFHWPDARLESHPLKDHPDLSIDWIWATPREKENLVLISTAEHGIEGFVGAAMLKVFIEEFAPQLNAEHTGLLLAHAINPWGMKHRYRVNPYNVDINRNFVLNGNFDPAINPGYDQLTSLLNPQGPLQNLALENTRFFARVVRGLVSPGKAKVQEASLLGQHRHPRGIYYGGVRYEEETQVLMSLYRASLEEYQNITQVDLHTGYGPRYQMTVIVPPVDAMPSAEATSRFHYPLVQKIDADEFYAISGDMGEYFYRLRDAEYPGKELFACGFEFGTFGDSLPALIRSLRITILENQMRQFGAKNEAIAQWVRKEYEELFFPQEPRWREKALADGRQALEGILRSFRLLE